MALLLKYKPIIYGLIIGDSRVSKFRISVGKNILSTPYELGEDAEVYGIIKKVYERDFAVPNIPEIPVTFILKSANFALDSLYISKESWEKIRDYGILADKNEIIILITHAIKDGKKIEIYPNRDVQD